VCPPGNCPAPWVGVYGCNKFVEEPFTQTAAVIMKRHKSIVLIACNVLNAVNYIPLCAACCVMTCQRASRAPRERPLLTWEGAHGNEATWRGGGEGAGGGEHALTQMSLAPDVG
jgi:hypothetical protein